MSQIMVYFQSKGLFVCLFSPVAAGLIRVSVTCFQINQYARQVVCPDSWYSEKVLG